MFYRCLLCEASAFVIVPSSLPAHKIMCDIYNGGQERKKSSNAHGHTVSRTASQQYKILFTIYNKRALYERTIKRQNICRMNFGNPYCMLTINSQTDEVNWKTEKTAARRKEKEAQIEIVCYMGNNSWFLQTGNQQDSKRSVGVFFLLYWFFVPSQSSIIELKSNLFAYYSVRLRSGRVFFPSVYWLPYDRVSGLAESVQGKLRSAPMPKTMRRLCLWFAVVVFLLFWLPACRCSTNVGVRLICEQTI